MLSKITLQPVIPSGGSVTLQWPPSHEQHPEQLLALTEDLTMLQATAKRLHGVQGAQRVAADPIVVRHVYYLSSLPSGYVAAGTLELVSCLSRPVATRHLPSL